eukprot:XP_011665078.1 PREDICTED: uncharacterized protein LOC100889500 [Strongylocentrotus purpuratus]
MWHDTTFSEHAEEYKGESILAPFQTSLPLGSDGDRSEHHHRDQGKPQVHVKEGKTKRKRGRPAGRTNAMKVQRLTPAAPPTQLPPSIKSNASSPHIPTATPAIPTTTPARKLMKVPDEDLSHFSPTVRSARLAFSRALAQSFNAMTSPDRTESVKRNLHSASSSDDTIATPAHGVYFQNSLLESTCDPSLRPSTFPQTMVIGVAPIDSTQHGSTFESSHRLLVGEGDLATEAYQDSAGEDYYSQSSVQYGEAVFGDERVQSIPGQPEPQPSVKTEFVVETNGSSHLASEPDLSLTLSPGAGIKEESIELAQPLGKHDSKGVKVPDPTRRSRLNQITGGLLNRLKMRAMTAEPTRD